MQPSFAYFSRTLTECWLKASIDLMLVTGSAFDGRHSMGGFLAGKPCAAAVSTTSCFAVELGFLIDFDLN